MLLQCNGMDKRVKDVTSFLSEERIVALAVQEAKLNTNNLPKGFPEATYYRPYRKKLAIRGLIWLIHPDWASITTKVPALGGDSDHVFWIKVDTREGPVFLANVYIPNGRRPQDIVDANEAVAQLLKDVAPPRGCNDCSHGRLERGPLHRKGVKPSPPERNLKKYEPRGCTKRTPHSEHTSQVGNTH